MRKTTIEEIIAAAGGSLIQRAPGPEAQAITGVKHDSREVEKTRMVTDTFPRWQPGDAEPFWYHTGKAGWRSLPGWE